ncbi:hypothetical protein GOBAR_AA17960 [Gossypium barbadense]|uniref:Vinorine synthase-like n=1 Tax=Gossypium barbadense TaxID=3634 RepID=A0A2P5XHD5_GOSBA|nr:hypothetical protein GOBAR_AA17960 [Gossypium barbadense]
MKLDVVVVSEEILKPSSPTPDRLRRYRLSFLDQLTPLLYNHLVYFYPKICDTEANRITILDRLKHSMSNAFTYFYPLAGRMMEDRLSIDCNDEGIPFVEVRVKCKLLDAINNVVPKELNICFLLKSMDTKKFSSESNSIDALSFFTFVNMWAAIARGETKLMAPSFESAALFPPRDLSGYTPIISQLKKEHVLTKSFVFGATKVEEIRRKYAESCNQTCPTRVEALSTFIWERLVTAISVRSRPNTVCTISHLVNIRARTEPPLPISSFGNLYSFAIIIPSMNSNIVTQMRDSIKTVNKEYVKKLQDGYNHYDKYEEIITRYGGKCEIIPLGFTSLCRFPLYESDFGWGKPIWAASAHREIRNTTVFMDAVNGNGIEAWVTLDEEELKKFDTDEELLAYVNAPKGL